MPLSLSEHKLPIGVTSVGLLFATGLAVAPIIMADSPTDILSASNATDIATINKSLQTQSDGLDQRFASLSADLTGQMNNLDAQVLILNKAVKNIDKKARKQTNSTDAALTEITNGPRLVNLEKAVSNLHRSQRKSSDAMEANVDQLKDKSSVRIANLEKAVKQLHLRQQKNKGTDSSAQVTAAASDDPELGLRLASIEREYRDVFSRMAALESSLQQVIRDSRNSERTAAVQPEAATVSNDSDTSGGNSNEVASRVQNLELMIQQLQNNSRPEVDRTDRRSLGFSDDRNSPDAETDIRIQRLERVIARMDRRMNSRGSNARAEEEMVDQLYEIQDYIDKVLNQLDR